MREALDRWRQGEGGTGAKGAHVYNVYKTCGCVLGTWHEEAIERPLWASGWSHRRQRPTKSEPNLTRMWSICQVCFISGLFHILGVTQGRQQGQRRTLWHHPLKGSGFQVPGLGFRFTGLAECQKSWHHQTGTRRHHANLQL